MVASPHAVNHHAGVCGWFEARRSPQPGSGVRAALAQGLRLTDGHGCVHGCALMAPATPRATGKGAARLVKREASDARVQPRGMGWEGGDDELDRDVGRASQVETELLGQSKESGARRLEAATLELDLT
ncbi:hypothetical protein O9K51_09584 [Purpureocillium lavendulum]|uniref:Uncharacterized protein n=1 Tax=Purpureocillium lavendulum TaxID=1247861 RepID=A0AB34FH64_9HYPO|nr:hypothetical protein O9K51_09584 [Purpureocillium lavendulum]